MTWQPDTDELQLKATQRTTAVLSKKLNKTTSLWESWKEPPNKAMGLQDYLSSILIQPWKCWLKCEKERSQRLLSLSKENVTALYLIYLGGWIGGGWKTNSLYTFESSLNEAMFV